RTIWRASSFVSSVSSANRADENSEIEGKAAKGSGKRVGKGASFSGAAGSSDTEGKAAKGSGERVGKGASFKSVVQIFSKEKLLRKMS
ncbi:MAG: hypothetical protein DME78_05180, partial [Verrucomicrobia bacterium]